MPASPRMLLVAVVGLAACAPPAAGVDADPGNAPDAITEGDADPMWITLFDGALTPDWRMSTIINQPGHDDPGGFDVEAGALVARPGTDIGLLWHTVPAPPDFELELEWRTTALDDNSGVFVRFPDLDSMGYDNTAFVAAHFGFEIQIDATGHPDGAPQHTTGAIYDIADQDFTLVPARSVGEWNLYRIRVIDQVYTVVLNGVQVTRFVNPDAARGLAAPAFIGIQTHTGNVGFRAIRIRPL
jgi:hypothetical protein